MSTRKNDRDDNRDDNRDDTDHHPTAKAPLDNSDTRQPVVFTFGKHKGRTVEEVAAIDPGYLAWCTRKIKGQPALLAEIKRVLKTIADAKRRTTATGTKPEVPPLTLSPLADRERLENNLAAIGEALDVFASTEAGLTEPGREFLAKIAAKIAKLASTAAGIPRLEPRYRHLVRRGNLAPSLN